MSGRFRQVLLYLFIYSAGKSSKHAPLIRIVGVSSLCRSIRRQGKFCIMYVHDFAEKEMITKAIKMQNGWVTVKLL